MTEVLESSGIVGIARTKTSIMVDENPYEPISMVSAKPPIRKGSMIKHGLRK